MIFTVSTRKAAVGVDHLRIEADSEEEASMSTRAYVTSGRA